MNWPQVVPTDRLILRRPVDDDAPAITWALTLRTDGRLIGMIGLRPRGFKHDIGYVLARPYWGRGLAAEAGRAIVDLCARAQRDRVTVRDPGRMSR